MCLRWVSIFSSSCAFVRCRVETDRIHGAELTDSVRPRAEAGEIFSKAAVLLLYGIALDSPARHNVCARN